MVLTICSRFNELLLQGQSNQSQVCDTWFTFCNCHSLNVLCQSCIELLRHGKQRLTSQHIQRLNSYDCVLSRVDSQCRVNYTEVYLVGELHVTSVLVSLQLVLTYRTSIRFRRNTFYQRRGVCLQRCPPTHGKFPCLILNRRFLSVTIVNVLVLSETDSVKQLFTIEHFWVSKIHLIVCNVHKRVNVGGRSQRIKVCGTSWKDNLSYLFHRFPHSFLMCIILL